MTESIAKTEAAKAAEQYPGPTGFAHLHLHTIFSPLDGVATPDALFERCAEFEMPAMAITDHGQLSSFPDAYWAAKAHDIKFIPGCEIYYCDYYHANEARRAGEPVVLPHPYLRGGETVELPDKLQAFKEEEPDLAARFRRNRHLTVLAKDMVGYKNLIQLTSQAWQHTFINKPRIWLDKLDEHREGLIVLSGCLNGPVAHEFWRMEESIRDKKPAKIKEFWHNANALVDRFREIFGDHYFIELQMPGPDIPNQQQIFWHLNRMSKKRKIPSVLTNDVHYLERRDFQLQLTMMAISQGVDLSKDGWEDQLFHVNSDNQFMKTRAQLRQTYLEGGYDQHSTLTDFETSCENTLMVAGMCQTFDPDLDPKLPEIADANERLRAQTMKGLEWRGILNSEKKYEIDNRMVTHLEQTEIELKRFIDKGFASYFLITEELVKFSRDSGWPIGPARGSAGGSVVCFALGIHDMDPLKWGLSFDRFLSPSRGGNMLQVTM